MKRARVAGRAKATKTMEARNEALKPGMAASNTTWTSQERKALLKAVEAHGKRAWQKVADAVGSRDASQCEHQYKDLKRAKRLDPIFETTLLRAKIFSGFTNKAFDKCVALVDGKRITTVGQLAALKLNDIEYLKKLTKCKLPGQAVNMASGWKEKAAAALAFWK